ncbi:carbohydrate-binding module family 18 protein [Didymella exigua CBS 183.55]|uniref:Carbohydrate-binding module family 18 protein n=1 Tax=Didymella exigua CBS 183.55 TaxID=1150837 RepID=A0A6A5RZN3_9PLEO|nr:carbohydrate-binding module family 18 protein [Didymella exigua CBS 183.55]KAF1932694.1 carbohydrate-binding module family 18 protein [Didymella exigua CBS 183.55]
MVPLLGLLYLLATVLSAVVSAENNIKFINHCPYDVYSWAVGPAGSGWTGHDHEAVAIPANTVTYQGMVDCGITGGGISVKLRDLPRYEVAPAGIIQVEYNLVPSKNHLWYDLSAVDCDHTVGPEHPSFCPLIGGGLKVYIEHADEGKCPPAWCSANGQCHRTYTEHGYWHGEPTFRCDAGKDVVVELCTKRVGPRTFNGHDEPSHNEPQPDKNPGNPSTNGICGARTSGGETCFDYARGSCCSQYGWCGYSDAHCGTGCQSGFGNCTSDSAAETPSYQSPPQPSLYSLPTEPSTLQPVYSKPTPSYHPPVSSYHPAPVYSPPVSSYSHPAPVYSPPVSSYSYPAPVYYPPVSSYSHPAPVYYPRPSSYHQPSTTPTPSHPHIAYTWPGHGKFSSSYAKPSTFKSVPYSKPTPSYGKPSHSHFAPPSSTRPTKPSRSAIYYPAPRSSKTTPVYSEPTPVHTKPASHTTPSDSKHTVYSTAPPHANPSSYVPPAHAPQREPQIPGSWYEAARPSQARRR